MNETNDPIVKLTSQVIPDDFPTEGAVEIPQSQPQPVPEQELAALTESMFTPGAEQQVAGLGRLGRIFRNTDNMARVRKNAAERPRAEDAGVDVEMPLEGQQPQEHEGGAEPLGMPGMATTEDLMEVAREPLVGTKVDPARNVNRNYSLDYIDTENEVQAVLDGTARAFDMHGSGPPRVSHAQTTAEAEAEYDLDVTLTTILGNPPDSTLNRKQLLNGRKALIALGKEVYGLVDMFLTTNMHTGEPMFRDGMTLDEKMLIKKRLTLLAAFNFKLQGAVKETARALNSMQIPASSDPIMQEAIKRDYFSAVTTEEELLGFAKLVKDTDGDMTKLNEVARKGTRATGMDMLMELWYNSVLSGIDTHGINIISNALVPLHLLAVDAGAATIGKGRKALQRLWYESQNKDMPASQEKALSYAAVGAQTVGLVGGYIDAFLMLAKFYQASNGGSAVDPANIKVDQARTPAITGDNVTKLFGGASGVLTDNFFMRTMTDVGGWAIRQPSRFLTTMDDFFKVANYGATVYEMAVNDAVRRASNGEYAVGSEQYYKDIEMSVAMPTARIHAAAVQREKLATFTNELTDKFSQKTSEVVRAVPLLNVLIPFIRVATNLFKYGANQTPLPLGVDAFNVMFRSGYQKEVRQTKLYGELFGDDPIARDRAMAKVGMGSAGVMALWSLMNGEDEDGNTLPLITGAGPKDFARKRMWMKAGWMPYSIYIDGKYYAYDRYDPAGIVMGSVATANELMNDTYNENERMNIAAAVIFGMAETLSDKLYLQNMHQTLTFFTTGSGSNPIRNTMSGFVPSFLAGIRRSSTVGVDPYKRQKRTKPDVNDARFKDGNVILDATGQFWTDLINAMKDRTPGHSNTLPMDVNWAGKPVLGAKDVGFFRFPPSYYTEPDLDPLTSELLHKGIVFNDNYTESVSWAVFKGDNDIPAGTYDLLLDDPTGQKHYEYRVMIGSAFESELRRVVHDKSYKDASKTEQYERITAAASRARKIGRESYERANKKRVNAFLKKYYGIGETTPGAYPPHQKDVDMNIPPRM